MLIWVFCAATKGHGVIQAQVAADGHVWVHSPMAARSMLKTKAYVATKVSTERQSWATTCSLVGVWVPSSHQNHSHDLNDLFFYPEPDAVQTPAAAKDHVFAHAPAVAGDYADICDMYHLRGHRNNV